MKSGLQVANGWYIRQNTTSGVLGTKSASVVERTSAFHFLAARACSSKSKAILRAGLPHDSSFPSSPDSPHSANVELLLLSVIFTDALCLICASNPRCPFFPLMV